MAALRSIREPSAGDQHLQQERVWIARTSTGANRSPRPASCPAAEAAADQRRNRRSRAGWPREPPLGERPAAAGPGVSTSSPASPARPPGQARAAAPSSAPASTVAADALRAARRCWPPTWRTAVASAASAPATRPVAITASSSEKPRPVHRLGSMTDHRWRRPSSSSQVRSRSLQWRSRSARNGASRGENAEHFARVASDRRRTEQHVSRIPVDCGCPPRGGGPRETAALHDACNAL